MTERRYVYAIQAAGAALPATLTGFDGRPVTSLPHAGLVAVVSAIDAPAIPPTVANARLHEAVVEAARAAGDTLPVRFGTLLDEEALRLALDERHDTLRADLARLGGMVEMSVTLLWEPPAFNEPAGGPPSTAAGPGARYLRARLTDHQRERALREQARRLSDALAEHVGPHVADQRHAILPAPRLATRAVCLLDPERVPAFRAAVDALRRRRPDCRALVSGPWPPYSFVTGAGTVGAGRLGALLGQPDEGAAVPA